MRARACAPLAPARVCGSAGGRQRRRVQSRRLSLGCTRVHMLAEMGRVAGRAIASTDVGGKIAEVVRLRRV